MSDRLRLAEDLRRFEPEPNVLVLLREGAAPCTLLGAEWRALLDAVGSGADRASLAERFELRIASPRLTQMIGHLRSKQMLLEEQEHAGPYGILATPPAAPTIRLTGFGDVDLASARTILLAGGVLCDDEATMHLVIGDDYLRAGLAPFNRDRLADGQAWLLAMPSRTEARIGPLFLPGRGPCWRCLESRHRPRHQSARFLGINGVAAAPTPGTSSGMAAAIAMLGPILERFAAVGEHAPLSDHVRTIDFAGGGWRDHRLVRRPQCPDCGDAAAATPRPLGPLSEGGRTVTYDGGHREVEPSLTFERLAHHLSPITGIADALIEAHLDERILCYGIVRSDVHPVRSPLDLVRSSIPVGLGWGKGWTHAQARMSALGEAIERFTFSDERPPDHVRASMAELGEVAIDPRSTLLFSDAQYVECGTGEGHDRIPEERFDPNLLIGWTAARSLTSGEMRLVASDQMWVTPLPTRDGRFCVPDSNGCAAGNSIEEAILQGLLELVERDSVAIWWYNQLSLPQVDLADFGENFVGLQRHYREAFDRDLWVLDLTMDLEIPVFAAISALRTSDRPEYVACFGCHFDPAIGIQRALTEMGLIMVGWKSYLSSSGVQPKAPLSIERWLRGVGREDQPQMRPSAAPARVRANYRPMSTSRCTADIETCVELLRSSGVEVVVANATRPDIGLPVVRVLAPGLRHFRPRFGLGRLFDVPVSLGHRAQPTAESALNPIPLPF
jgi:bacteriocin biosynthesis cyclodehydratase domain-containing protein